MTDPPSAQPDPAPAQVVELAVNLDDLSPELVGDAAQRLLEAGALDVWTTAIGMKKQRPGVTLSVLTTPEARAATARRVLELTGSFGLRYRDWDRLVLERGHVELPTRYGAVAVKVGRLEGEVVVAAPEFSSVRAAAQASGADPRRVMDAARAAAEAWRDGPGRTRP
ncbi:MAG: nickel insertion protein [Planctomycetota bacterium]